MRIPGYIFLLGVFILTCMRANPEEIGATSRPDTLSGEYEIYVDSAEWYAGKSLWKEAERMTVRALRTDPANKSNWLLWANLGEIRFKDNNPEGAIEAFDIGLNRNPSSIRMLEGRAAALIETGNMAVALDDLDMVIERDSIREWPRMMRAMLYASLGRTTEAQADFMSLINHHPDNANGYLGLARIYASKRDDLKAKDMFRKSLEKDDRETTRIYYISFLADSGNLSEASEALREAMKAHPRNGNMFLLRAYIHKLRFHNEEAEIDKKLALEYGADPQLVETIFSKFKR